MQVKQLIAKLQQLNPNATVEGFAHNNATFCYFDVDSNNVVYDQDDRTDYVNKDVVVLHFNVEPPVVV